MSSVATRGGSNVPAVQGNPWAEVARGIEDGAYLKFNGNTGDLTYGSNDEELPVGSQIVVDMHSFADGWICWVNSAVEEEILIPVTQGRAPLEHDLPDHGPYDDEDDGWRAAVSFPAVLARVGEDESDEAVGTKLLFKSSTGGPVRSAKKLAGAYGRAFAQHMDEFPIVELAVDSYMPKVKKHGKKYSLLFKIVGWMSEAEMEGLAHGEADGAGDYEDEPAPARRPAASSKALPAPKEEAAPAPRRRAAPVQQEEEEPAPAPRRRAAPAPVEEEEEPAPAPRRRAAPAPVEEEYEEEVAPAPRRRAAPAPVEEEEEPAPAPRRRAAPAPVEEEYEDEPAPAPRRRAAPAPVEDEDEGLEAPAPRGRSAGRAAPPANARVRKFD